LKTLSPDYLRGNDAMYVHVLQVGDAFGVDNYSSLPFNQCAQGFSVSIAKENPLRKHHVIAMSDCCLISININKLEKKRLVTESRQQKAFAENLKRVRGFEDIKLRTLRFLAGFTQIWKFNRGETIFIENDDAVFSGFIIEGEVSSSKRVDTVKTASIPLNGGGFKHYKDPVCKKLTLQSLKTDILAPEAFFKTPAQKKHKYDFTVTCKSHSATVVVVAWNDTLRKQVSQYPLLLHGLLKSLKSQRLDFKQLLQNLIKSGNPKVKEIQFMKERPVDNNTYLGTEFHCDFCDMSKWAIPGTYTVRMTLYGRDEDDEKAAENRRCDPSTYLKSLSIYNKVQSPVKKFQNKSFNETTKTVVNDNIVH